jgi:hypothetical protein
MFGNGEIDSHYGLDMNQRMFMAAVGNVLNNRFAWIEFFWLAALGSAMGFLKDNQSK